MPARARSLFGLVLVAAAVLPAGAQPLTFAKTDYPSAPGARAIATADFNRDGWPDVAHAGIGTTQLSVLLSVGGQGFAPAMNVAIGLGAFDLTTGDFNRDGITDIATGNYPFVYKPGSPITVETWEEVNATWIGAVEKEKGLVTFLFALISIVAIFLIFSIFYMIVVEKTKDIGIIKSVGATGQGVASVFLGYGLAIGIVAAVVVGVGAARLLRPRGDDQARRVGVVAQVVAIVALVALACTNVVDTVRTGTPARADPHSMRSVAPSGVSSIEIVSCSTGALVLATFIGARPRSSRASSRPSRTPGCPFCARSAFSNSSRSRA